MKKIVIYILIVICLFLGYSKPIYYFYFSDESNYILYEVKLHTIFYCYNDKYTKLDNIDDINKTSSANFFFELMNNEDSYRFDEDYDLLGHININESIQNILIENCFYNDFVIGDLIFIKLAQKEVIFDEGRKLKKKNVVHVSQIKYKDKDY